jgi:hypothetical protein
VCRKLNVGICWTRITVAGSSIMARLFCKMTEVEQYPISLEMAVNFTEKVLGMSTYREGEGSQ